MLRLIREREVSINYCWRGENRRGPGRSTLTGENNLAHTEPGICLSLTPGVFLSLSFSLPPSLPLSCTPSSLHTLRQSLSLRIRKCDFLHFNICWLSSVPGYFVPTSSQYQTVKETNLGLIMNFNGSRHNIRLILGNTRPVYKHENKSYK